MRDIQTKTISVPAPGPPPGHAARTTSCESALRPSFEEFRDTALRAGRADEEIAFAMVNLSVSIFQRSEAAKDLESAFGMAHGELTKSCIRIEPKGS